MPYLLIRHKVKDFGEWKSVYDGHITARRGAGLEELFLLRNADNPNEVVILFEAEDHTKARELVTSEDLQQAMERAGVIDGPDIYFLDT
jgi:hypothetical protein